MRRARILVTDAKSIHGSSHPDHAIYQPKHMTTDILTQEFVQSAIESEKNGVQFPIDLDDVWGAAGYTRRDNAIRRIKTYLVEGEDFSKNSDSLPRGVYLHREENTEGRPGDKYYLSVDGYDHFLLTASTKEGREARKRFIQYKKAYLRSLEALFSAPSIEASIDTIQKMDRVEALERALAQSQEKEKQSKQAHNKFPISIDELKATTQIVNKSQIKAAIVRDLVLDEEYCELDGKIYLTLPIYHILCMSFRSLAGTDISKLPEELKVQTARYFRLQENRRCNVRMGKRDKTSPGQMNLKL